MRHERNNLDGALSPHHRNHRIPNIRRSPTLFDALDQEQRTHQQTLPLATISRTSVLIESPTRLTVLTGILDSQKIVPPPCRSWIFGIVGGTSRGTRSS